MTTTLAAYYTDVARQNGVVARTLARSPSDSGLRRATAAWLGCMRRRGQRLDSPAQAREGVLARYVRSGRTGRIRGIELRIAAADRACGNASGVYREQRASERAVVASVAPEDVAVLEAKVVIAEWATRETRLRSEACRSAIAAIRALNWTRRPMPIPWRFA
jgi:hypothetical protein